MNIAIRRWTRRTFLGYALGFALSLVFIALSGAIGLGETQFPVGLGMGLGVGLLQKRVMAEQIQAGAAWARASTVGVTAPFAAGDIAHALALDLPYSLAAAVVAAGLAAGVLQWLVLRPRVSGSALWIPASLVGWGLAGSAVVLNDRLLPRIPGIVGALIYIGVILLGGVLLGLATGAAWQRMPAAAAQSAPPV